MSERPTAQELTEAIAEFLGGEILPMLTDPRLRFRTLVAMNALGIVHRELDALPRQDDAELRELARRIRAGDVEPDTLQPCQGERRGTPAHRQSAVPRPLRMSRLPVVPDLSGKIAIVTGAGRGIGRAHSLALAAAGAKVVVNDLGGSLAGEGADLSPAEQVVAEIAAAGGEAVADGENVADFEGARCLVAHAVAAFGGLDIVINNAGILRDRMLVNMSEEEWDAVIAVHLKGHFAVTRHAAEHWRERAKAGEQLHARVINTSSPSGVFGNVGQTNYGAAKAGIAGFTVIAAQELARYGVTVNCLAPNARTRMTEETFEIGDRPEGFDPLDPANMSPVVIALCADDAQEITGQVFHIWGGAVNALQGWTGGELFQRDDGWDADALLAAMLERFPGGAAPAGMVAGMQNAGGQSLRANS